MDNQMIDWAVLAGFTVASPICIAVGTTYAFGTTMNREVYSLPKVLGWACGIPLALVSGTYIAPHLVPYMWEEFGAVYSSGFGWLGLWGFIRMTCHDESLLVRLLTKWANRSKTSPKPKQKKSKDDIQLKVKPRDETEGW